MIVLDYFRLKGTKIMKITIKHIIISSACLFFASHLFAFDAHRIDPVDVRSLSMGGITLQQLHLLKNKPYYQPFLLQLVVH